MQIFDDRSSTFLLPDNEHSINIILLMNTNIRINLDCDNVLIKQDDDMKIIYEPWVSGCELQLPCYHKNETGIITAIRNDYTISICHNSDHHESYSNIQWTNTSVINRIFIYDELSIVAISYANKIKLMRFNNTSYKKINKIKNVEMCAFLNDTILMLCNGILMELNPITNNLRRLVKSHRVTDFRVFRKTVAYVVDDRVRMYSMSDTTDFVCEIKDLRFIPCSHYIYTNQDVRRVKIFKPKHVHIKTGEMESDAIVYTNSNVNANANTNTNTSSNNNFECCVCMKAIR
jgi:hypothetical protein